MDVRSGLTRPRYSTSRCDDDWASDEEVAQTGPKRNGYRDSASVLVPGPAPVPTSTRMLRHLPWLKRQTLKPQRVMWPTRIAIQISIGSRWLKRWTAKQMPSGTITCDTIEM